MSICLRRCKSHEEPAVYLLVNFLDAFLVLVRNPWLSEYPVGEDLWLRLSVYTPK